jgi:CheY-like chemotaxis protein
MYGASHVKPNTRGISDLSVMVVEDYDLLRDLIRNVLAPYFPDLHAFASVSTSMAWLDTHKPDILLCDLSLRDGNGLDVIERAATCNPFVAVVICSGNSCGINVGTKIGRAQQLNKPFTDAELRYAAYFAGAAIIAKQNEQISLPEGVSP